MKPPVQLTFPCPACGRLLSLEGYSASGPCPTCGTPISASLKVSTGHGSPAAEPSPERITPIGNEGPNQLKYDERRFRPVLRLPSQDNQGQA